MPISSHLDHEVVITPSKKVQSKAFLLALVLFGLLNLLLGYVDNVAPFTKLSLDAVHFDYRGTEHDVERLANAPNLVLAGSSLLLYPMWRIDQSDGANEVDSNHYHFAKSLDRQFSKAGMSVTTYSLATGGAMISDSYLLLTHYLHHHPAPQFVVLDCAPRSFYDGGMVEPDATPIFHCCTILTDFFSLSKAYMPSLISKLNYWGCKLCFTYHHRRSLSSDIVQFCSDPSAEKLDLNAFKTFFSSTSSLTASKANTGSSASADIGADTQARFNYSLLDYQARYFLINTYQMQKELNFLKRINTLCTEHGVKLIVVNMPLTKENLSLLPRGFYNDFKNSVKAMLTGEGSYIDLNEIRDWPRSLYSDSVHLNDKGAAEFNKQIVGIIAPKSRP